MRTRRSTPTRLAFLALAAAPCLLRAGPAQGDPPASDGVPSGTMAFFSGGKCPVGWVAADVVRGRLVVAVTDSALAGMTVGAPLTDREDRTHQHTYTGTVQAPDKAIAGADGSNDNGAAAQAYTVSGSTDPQPTGLPFVQVQACAKP